MRDQPQTSAAGPEAIELQRRRTTRAYAEAHDLLDRRAVPRFAKQKDAEGRLVEFSLPERLELAFDRTVHLPWRAIQARRRRKRNAKSGIVSPR